MKNYKLEKLQNGETFITSEKGNSIIPFLSIEIKKALGRKKKIKRFNAENSIRRWDVVLLLTVSGLAKWLNPKLNRIIKL